MKKLNISKLEIKQVTNVVINMYAFFAIIEILLSYVHNEPYSIHRVLLYSFLAHGVAFILSVLNKESKAEDEIQDEIKK